MQDGNNQDFPRLNAVDYSLAVSEHFAQGTLPELWHNPS